jgi:hypothetical protein
MHHQLLNVPNLLGGLEGMKRSSWTLSVPRNLKHSSNSGGAFSTVWYEKVFLYSAGQLGTVCEGCT